MGKLSPTHWDSVNPIPTTDIRTDIVDNFLSDKDFKKLQERFTGSYGVGVDWYYSEYVASNKEETDNDFYMTHMIFAYPQGPISPTYNELMPMISKLDPTSIIRIKANLFPNQGKLKEHVQHTDYAYPHQGAILYINTCDGYTLLEDGSRVSSVANRMLFFDASKPHASTTTTNTKARININFNYHAFLK